ncbi:MAG: hypothetical protein AB1801_24040 [Chloroflexota bacterium]
MSRTASGKPANLPAPPPPLIRASELAQFDFCRRAWWLGTVKGWPADNRASLKRGTAGHRFHGRQVHLAARWRRVGLLLLAGGGLLLVTAVVRLWLF